jgi:hypothetical protein
LAVLLYEVVVVVVVVRFAVVCVLFFERLERKYRQHIRFLFIILVRSILRDVVVDVNVNVSSITQKRNFVQRVRVHRNERENELRLLSSFFTGKRRRRRRHLSSLYAESRRVVCRLKLVSFELNAL